MSETDLVVQGSGWIQLLLGTAVFLLPGLAAADRWLTGVPLRWVWSPVLSFTLLALAAVLLDFALGMPVRPGVTWTLALGIALLLVRPRLPVLWRALRGLPGTVRPWASVRRVSAGAWLLLFAVLPFLFVMHSLPHLPGEQPTGPLDLVDEVASRGWALARGADVPYPVHVDEHYHIARMATIDRTGDVRIDDPYTGEPEGGDLFTVGGMRSERGWQVALVQLHHLTGVSFPTMAHFLPALWATYLGIALWALLRPAPGAVAAAAFTAILPTTLRFLGVGFLVPSAFALPWILAVVAIAARGEGPGRLAALASLITGAYFMHLVPGTVALVAGLATALMRPVPAWQRVGLVVALLLPLLWIYPAAGADARAAVGFGDGLAFQQGVFLSAGALLLALAVLGAGAAFVRPDPAKLPVRVLAVLCLLTIFSLTWSVATDHRSDATYSRLVPTFFLCLAGLAGAGIGATLVGCRWLTQRSRSTSVRRFGGAAAPIALIVVVAVALVPAAEAKLREPYYRVFDASAWATVNGFAGVEAHGEVFLSHPWQAPLHSGFTGGRPWTVLYPGAPPEKAADFGFYVQTGGSPSWFEERDIRYVVGPTVPNAPHDMLAPGVYRLSTASLS